MSETSKEDGSDTAIPNEEPSAGEVLDPTLSAVPIRMSEEMSAKLLSRIETLEKELVILRGKHPTRDPGVDSAPKEQDPKIKYVEVKVIAGKSVEKTTSGISGISPSHDSASTDVYTIKRTFKADNSLESTEITIESRELQALIYMSAKRSSIHSGWTEDRLLNRAVTWKSPFFIILTNWEALRNSSLADPRPANESEEAQKYLRKLLEDVRLLLPDAVNGIEDAKQSGMINYNAVYALFTPGEYIVANLCFNEPQLFQIDSSSLGTSKVTIQGWAYDWDGTKLDRKVYRFDIDSYEENTPKKITELPCYPVEFYEDGKNRGLPALRAKIQKRGEKFRRYCIAAEGAQKMFLHDGSAMMFVMRAKMNTTVLVLEERLGSLSSAHADSWREDNYKGDIIIDPKHFLRYEPASPWLGNMLPSTTEKARGCQICATESRRRWIQNFDKEMNYDDYSSRKTLTEFDDNKDHTLLLPARILGFALHAKMWAQFAVNDIKEVDDGEKIQMNLENDLVFPDGSRLDELRSLVGNHVKVAGGKFGAPMKDFTAGKGNGLIILLHGPTGVGKTLTAEILAREATKPLYKVGASDIGTDPIQAETQLKGLFERAQAWNAVLLIDEADAFLDSRGSKGEANVEKNALVAVLLREVEFFGGILIMTTNRTKSFDIAMLSRIHWSVNFGRLTNTQEMKVWKIWIRKWEDASNELVKQGNVSQRRVAAEKKSIEAWVSGLLKNKPSKLNGREIRNVFIVAKTLANDDLTTLGNIMSGFENISTFRDSIHDFKLTDESQHTYLRQ